MKEWRDIPGYGGKYRVSDCGDIFSIARDREMKLIVNFKGYLMISLKLPDGKQKRIFVHRAVLEAFVSPHIKGMFCRHLDGNPANNSATNLAWGTRDQNEKDKRSHGTALIGSRSRQTKFNDADVLVIIREPLGTVAVAKKYGVDRKTIQRIKDGTHWSHVTGLRFRQQDKQS